MYVFLFCVLVTLSYRLCEEEREILLHCRIDDGVAAFSLKRESISINLSGIQLIRLWNLQQQNVGIYKHHIGGGFYITTSANGVDLRRFDEGDIITTNGIFFSISEWNELINLLKEMIIDLDKLSYSLPQDCEDTHHNQMSYFTCSECNPYTFMQYFDW